MMSTTSYGPVPLWWRRIPSDYQTPLFQGMASLDEKEAQLRAFGSPHSSLAEFKRAVMGLLELPPARREEAMLRAQAAKYLMRSERLPDGKTTDQVDDFKRRLEQAKDAPELVGLLLAEAGRKKDRDGSLIGAVLRRGGGQITLDAIGKLPAKKAPFDEDERKRIVEGIRARLTPNQPRDHHARDDGKAPAPSARQRAKLMALLKKQPELRDAGEALETLTVHEPAAVVEYLQKWVNPEKHWADHDAGYSLGSYFAWQCGRDRKENLTRLLSAKDNFIRVAGAVYLCFEDRELGLQKLKELSGLEGDPGVWAALNRARRGDKSAVPRTLEVFSTGGPSNMEGVPHRNLQKRLIVLLSNTAKASGFAQPRPPLVESDDDADYRKLHDFYKGWWAANADKAVLTDPWLELLEKQKVD
jgi:hypothetical protein